MPWIQAFIWAFKPTDIVDIRRFPAEEAQAIEEEIARLKGVERDAKPQRGAAPPRDAPRRTRRHERLRRRSHAAGIRPAVRLWLRRVAVFFKFKWMKFTIAWGFFSRSSWLHLLLIFLIGLRFVTPTRPTRR